MLPSSSSLFCTVTTITMMITAVVAVNKTFLNLTSIATWCSLWYFGLHCRVTLSQPEGLQQLALQAWHAGSNGRVKVTLETSVHFLAVLQLGLVRNYCTFASNDTTITGLV